MDKKEGYSALLAKRYDEAVEFLLQKYGPAEDDYFMKKSYERFLNGEIKSIVRGKYSRSDEGLECHHIDENKFLNMSNPSLIESQKIPFAHHRKERLVFCDVVEHAILHILIAKETSLEFGYPGFSAYLRIKIKDWYIDKNNIPEKSRFQIACYYKSYLEREEATELLEKMDNILASEQERVHQEKFEKLSQKIEKGNFKSLNHKSSRHEVVRAMYDLTKIGAFGYRHLFNDFVYSEEQDKKIMRPVGFEVFESRMAKYDLSGIVKNIQLYVSYIEGEINCREYLEQSNLFAKTTKEAEDERRDHEEKAKLEKEKTEAFYSAYPKFEQANIRFDVKRQEVNALLFEHNKHYLRFIEFQSAMKEYSRSELLDMLHSLI